MKDPKSLNFSDLRFKKGTLKRIQKFDPLTLVGYAQLGKLQNLKGIGKVSSRSITHQLMISGYIFDESVQSRGLRRLIYEIYDNLEYSLMHSIPYSKEDIRAFIKNVLEYKLGINEVEIIVLRNELKIGRVLNFKEIARRLGISRNCAEQLETNALLKLKDDSCKDTIKKIGLLKP